MIQRHKVVAYTDFFLNLLQNTWTHHLTVLEDEQEGDGLNALSQALQDVWVLQNPERQTRPEQM